MTLSIRLEGLPHEVDQMIKLLKSNPALVDVIRVSRGYANRDSTSIRRYVDIEFATAAELGITRFSPIIDIVSAAEVERQ